MPWPWRKFRNPCGRICAPTPYGCLWLILALWLSLAACAGSGEHRQRQADVHRHLGEAYLSQGRFSHALVEFKAAKQVAPDDPRIENYLGLTYRAQGDLGLAATHFQKALAIDPQDASALNNLGETHLARKDWDAAIGLFQQLERNPLYTTPQYVYLNLGWAYFNKGVFDKAATYYGRVLAHYEGGYPKDVTYVKGLRGLANTLAAMDELSQAQVLLEQAADLAPQFAPLFLDLGTINARRGQAAPALAAWQRVVEIAPDSPEANAARAAIQRLEHLPDRTD